MLLLGQAANQETVPGFGNDVSVKAFHHHGLFAGRVHEAVAAAEKAHVGAHHRVPVFIGLDVGLDGAPASQVAPGQVFGDDIDAGALLHYGVVDGDLFAGGKQPVQGLVLSGGEEGRGQLVHHAGNLRGIGAQFIHDGIQVPDEDAGVPEVMAVFQIADGGVQVRFLLEFAHLDQLAVQGFGGVDVARLGTGGGDAHRDDGVALLRELQCLGDGVGEFLRLEHQGIGRGYHDIGLRVLPADFPGGIGDTGGGVAAFGDT